MLLVETSGVSLDCRENVVKKCSFYFWRSRPLCPRFVPCKAGASLHRPGHPYKPTTLSLTKDTEVVTLCACSRTVYCI